MYTPWITATISIPKVLSNVLSVLWKQGNLSCNTLQASSQEGCFLWQKEFPVYFQLAVLPHWGSSRHTKRNFPNIVIKHTSKQIVGQREGHELPGWGTMSYRYFFILTYPQGKAHSSASPYIPGTVLALMKVPTSVFFHYTVFTVCFQFCPMRCSVSNRNSLFAVTELQLCLDTEQPLPLVRYFFPTQRISMRDLNPLCYWFLILWNEITAKNQPKIWINMVKGTSPYNNVGIAGVYPTYNGINGINELRLFVFDFWTKYVEFTVTIFLSRLANMCTYFYN